MLGQRSKAPHGLEIIAIVNTSNAPAKPVEERANPAIRLRARKGKAERKNQKTHSGNNDGGDDALRKDPELPICPTKKWRRNKKKIDRQVWQYQERHERNRTFPLKIE